MGPCELHGFLFQIKPSNHSILFVEPCGPWWSLVVPGRLLIETWLSKMFEGFLDLLAAKESRQCNLLRGDFWSKRNREWEKVEMYATDQQLDDDSFLEQLD